MVKYCESCQLEVESPGNRCPECQSQLKIISKKESIEPRTTTTTNLGNEQAGGVTDSAAVDGARSTVDDNRTFSESKLRNGSVDAREIINTVTSSTMFRPMLMGIAIYSVLWMISIGVSSLVLRGENTVSEVVRFGTWALYDSFLVTVTVNGVPRNFPPLASIFAPLIFLVGGLLSLKLSPANRRENVSGLIIGAVVFTFVVAITVASGTVSSPQGFRQASYGVNLFEAILFMGLLFPAIYGLYSNYAPAILRGSGGHWSTLACAGASPYVVPIIGPLFTLICSRILWREDRRISALASAVFGVVALVVTVPVLVVVLQGTGLLGGLL